MTERTPGSPTAAVGTILARAFWYLGRSPARGRGRGARNSPPLLAASDYAVSASTADNQVYDAYPRPVALILSSRQDSCRTPDDIRLRSSSRLAGLPQL
jgi:hypothetical protein